MGGTETVNRLEAQEIIAGMRYKPNCVSMDIIDNYDRPWEACMFRLVMRVEDAYGKRPPDNVASLMALPPLEFLDRDGLIEQVRRALGEWEMHERDEWFLVNGERLFDPHKPPEIRRNEMPSDRLAARERNGF